MKSTIIKAFLLLVCIAALVILNAGLYTVQETEQVILTQFGKPVGDAITTAGLHLKTPFIQSANRLDKRIMEWDGSAQDVQTKDKLFIAVDTYARWRIMNPLLFFQSLRDEATAQSRLDDILDGETQITIAQHPLLELVRTDKDRQPTFDETLISVTVQAANWPTLSLGREAIARQIYEGAYKKLLPLGIELIDIRFKRIQYNTDVQSKIYERMSSERKQIADKFRAEGEGEAARILGEKERDLKKIQSEAYKQIQEIRGKADAKATDIYAKAYNQSPEAYNFYQFQKTMETYLVTLDKSTTLILSTSGDFFQFLQNTGLEVKTAPKAQTALDAVPPSPPVVAPQP